MGSSCKADALILCRLLGFSVNCCCCYYCLPSETYGRNGVTPIFRSFHRTARRLEHCNVLFIYHYEHYGLIFGPYGCSGARTPNRSKLKSIALLMALLSYIINTLIVRHNLLLSVLWSMLSANSLHCLLL